MSSNFLITGKRLIMGVEITLESNMDGTLQIERIEVPKEKRCQGLATAALKELANEAKKQSIDLSACICSDLDKLAVTNGLRGAFSKAGFLPLAMDGEVYLNDVKFMPSRKKVVQYEMQRIDRAQAGDTYYGEIVDVLEDSELIVQHIGRGLHIAHNSTNLEQTVSVGDKVKIIYNEDGLGKVQPEKLQRQVAQQR